MFKRNAVLQNLNTLMSSKSQHILNFETKNRLFMNSPPHHIQYPHLHIYYPLPQQALVNYNTIGSICIPTNNYHITADTDDDREVNKY